MDRRTEGQKGRRAEGQTGRRTEGQEVKRTDRDTVIERQTDGKTVPSYLATAHGLARI